CLILSRLENLICLCLICKIYYNAMDQHMFFLFIYLYIYIYIYIFTMQWINKRSFQIYILLYPY
ncbi:MAG: hypothetical protein N7Q72_07520, partial [Spiroplasma sp. Tabriz.8]|nr:hypothetical protein [Spiroplasma sp. Tabriz.8]